MKNVYRIGICAGDLNGIGIEVFYKALNNFFDSHKNLSFFIFVNPSTLFEYLMKMNYDFQITSDDEVKISRTNIKIVPLSTNFNVDFGKISYESGKHSIESIEKAVNWAKEKKIDGIVTLPINKKAVNEAGFSFPGNTEFIAYLCGKQNPLMLFVYRKLRIALTTIHIPVSEVPKTISIELLNDKIKTFEKTLVEDFLISSPKIAIIGLNPHCGEGGLMGSEEEKIIIPTINELKSLGYNLFGPFPADSFFGGRQYVFFDGILSMYHDQGLSPFKMISKMFGVNYTANLPIIRTSPDHGTGFDIAGKNIALPFSLIESIKLAIQLIKNRRRIVIK